MSVSNEKEHPKKIFGKDWSNSEKVTFEVATSNVIFL